jgi:regulator of protease activity HflC (stomatin/prohibitin superfamily)
MMVFFGIAKEWEKHAVFFLGKLSRIVGPGIYFYIPIVERVLFRIDTRIITYTIPLQRGLTRDNIPVEVDAIVFYQVKDTRAAILNVDNYHHATQLGARSAIRDMVGKSHLDELLSEREKIGQRLREHIDEFASRWGVTVISVEIKDVIVSRELEDAISREAAAEREKRARVKLAEAETLAAGSIVEASKQYQGNPIALQLRSMNMLYEMCMEGKSTMVFVPTERTTGGMPGVIGVESIQDLLKQSPPSATSRD